MSEIFTIVLGVAMLLFGVLALYLKDLVASVIAAGVLSLFASILYLVLQAPDVALTEAAIGAGLSTMIFLLAIKKTKRYEADND
jgi:uncharacterized MnhB-related membrane protein